MKATSSEVNEFVREVLPKGYQLGRRSPRAPHLVLLDPKGEVVRSEDGRPIPIPNSPSDHRWRANLTAQLVGAGVLGQDPAPIPPEAPGRASVGAGQDQERVGYSAVTGSAEQGDATREGGPPGEGEQSRDSTPLPVRAPGTYSCRDCAIENGEKPSGEWRCPFHVKMLERERLTRSGLDPCTQGVHIPVGLGFSRVCSDCGIVLPPPE